jgi:hypothetical protein
VKPIASLPLGQENHKDAIRWLARLPDRAFDRALYQVVSDRSSRPADLSEQYLFLRALSEWARVALPMRINCKVAAAHKSMEMMSDELAIDMLELLENALSDVEGLKPSVSTRRDRAHQLVSIYSALLQLELFVGRIVSFYERADAARSQLMVMPAKTLTRAFFSTSTNFLRCLAFSSLRSIGQANAADVQGVVYAMEQVCNIALTKNSYRQIKKYQYDGLMRFFLGFLSAKQGRKPAVIREEQPGVVVFEFLQGLSVYHHLCEARKYLSERGLSAVLDNDLLRFECSVLRSAIRSENSEKVDKMIANYAKKRVIFSE